MALEGEGDGEVTLFPLALDCVAGAGPLKMDIGEGDLKLDGVVGADEVTERLSEHGLVEHDNMSVGGVGIEVP